MIIINDKFKRVRLDQSPHLPHSVSGCDHSPCDTLQKILEEKQLIGDKGYICLPTSPITTIKHFFEIKTKNIGQPMYLLWRLGFSRDILVRDFGVRNVIYTDGNEDIPKHLKWRVGVLNVDSYDFKYLREWKIREKTFNFSSFPQGETTVIAPDTNPLDHLVVKFDMKFTPYVSYYTGDIEEDWGEESIREWKGISVDKLGINSLLDDLAVSGATISQEIDEDMVKKLISETPWNLLTKRQYCYKSKLVFL